ncbi:hypothetical protein IWZ01DRAFT_139589 [Phyllosticta capitalensis]
MASAGTPRKRSFGASSLEDFEEVRSDTAQSSSPSTETQRDVRSTTPPPADERVQAPSPEEEDIDPSEPLPAMDWPHLQERYHRSMGERNEAERELYKEFADLINYFNIWAQTSTIHETDRSFARLKTRSAHTQRYENSTEETRQHYQMIVQAFQSALELLNGR